MFRLSFVATGLISVLNFLLTEDIILRALIVTCILLSFGLAIVWPDPIPPPPPKNLWSEAPEEKKREMRTCSSCGKAVDQKWTMCPYCSKRV